MDRLPDQVLREFTEFYDEMERFVAELGPGSDLGPLEETLHHTYHQRFGGPGMDETVAGSREAAIGGMKGMLESGHKVQSAGRTIRLSSPNEAVVFVERVVTKEGEAVARAFHVETYRLIDGNWRMVRESMEILAP